MCDIRRTYKRLLCNARNDSFEGNLVLIFILIEQ